MWQGRFDEALKESDRARQLDPLSLVIATDRGAIFYYSRQYDRAIQEFLRVREMDPHFLRAASLMATAYAYEGKFDKSFGENIPNLDAPWSWMLRAQLYGLAGRRADAQNALNGLLKLQQRLPPDESLNLGYLAVAYLSVGKNEEALAALERAYQEQPDALTSLKVDPVYDPLRDNPRFRKLLQQVNFDKVKPNG